MDDNQESRFERIKRHIKANKTTYIVGASCLTAGYFLRPQVVNIVDAFNFKYKSPTTTNVITVLNRRACQNPIPVRDKLTGEVYASLRRAAKITGESLSNISKDAQGARIRFEELPVDVLV